MQFIYNWRMLYKYFCITLEFNDKSLKESLNINPERFDTADWLEGCDDAGDDKEEDEVCSRPKTAN